MTAYQPLINDKLTQLNLALDEISVHNSNVQGRTGGLLHALQSALKLTEDSTSKPSLSSAVKEYNTAANAQEMLHSHSASFSKVGIGLNKHDNGSIVFFVQDIQKITRFINQIPKESAEDNKQILQLVAKGLEAQIVGLVEIEDRQLVEDAIGDLESLYRALRSRGLDKEIERSNRLLSAAEGEYLNEQLLVDKSGLLNSGFGPRQWHNDSSASGLYNRWNESIELLSELRRNPKGDSLTARVILTLGTGLESFQADLKSWSEGRFPYSQGNLKDYEGVYRLIKGDFEDKLRSWQYL